MGVSCSNMSHKQFKYVHYFGKIVQHKLMQPYLLVRSTCLKKHWAAKENLHKFYKIIIISVPE